MVAHTDRRSVRAGIHKIRARDDAYLLDHPLLVHPGAHLFQVHCMFDRLSKVRDELDINLCE